VRQDKLAVIPGTVPSPIHWPVGCRFHDRCPYSWDKCVREMPPLLQARTDPSQTARCWLETNPERRAEVRARGSFGVKLEDERPSPSVDARSGGAR
jgi:hypothetical protein